MKKYTTPRLVLRPLRPSDYLAWSTALASLLPRQSKHDWIPGQKKFSRAEFRKVLNWRKRKRDAENLHVWALFTRAGGELIGRVDISVLHWHKVHAANLGYILHNTHWRQGYMSEALRVLLPSALRELRLNRLEAVIDLDNRPSQALCRSLGMKREGIRKRYYYQNGGWDDQVIYAITRHDLGLPVLRLP